MWLRLAVPVPLILIIPKYLWYSPVNKETTFTVRVLETKYAMFVFLHFQREFLKGYRTYTFHLCLPEKSQTYSEKKNANRYVSAILNFPLIRHVTSLILRVKSRKTVLRIDHKCKSNIDSIWAYITCPLGRNVFSETYTAASSCRVCFFPSSSSFELFSTCIKFTNSPNSPP